MNSYNIVTNYKINQVIRSKSKYYRVNLGFSATTESNSADRILNQKDEFAYFYNTTYKTTIMAQGSIGNIRFYTDHYILEDKIAFYYKNEEFIFDFEINIVTEKGIDFYLGYLIKKIETEYVDRLKKEQEAKEAKKEIVANPEKVFKNPGNVTYEDLKAYMEKQRLERMNTKT
jgi:hypothetical protein